MHRIMESSPRINKQSIPRKMTICDASANLMFCVLAFFFFINIYSFTSLMIRNFDSYILFEIFFYFFIFFSSILFVCFPLFNLGFYLGTSGVAYIRRYGACFHLLGKLNWIKSLLEMEVTTASLDLPIFFFQGELNVYRIVN
jgi:hypothetical protein